MQRPSGRPRVSKLGLVLLGVFVVLLAAVAVAATKTLTFVSSVSTASLADNIRSVVSNTTGKEAAPLPERINLLLLGYGGVGHDGAYLTDSIMVLSFDAKTKRAAMISVPRDIWVKIPTDGTRGGFWKINTAYSMGLDDQSFPSKSPEFKGRDGGGHLAESVVGSILGMKIDYYVAVDFHAFKAMVDALGGVDVDVETAFTDHYYPRNDDPEIDPGWMTIHFDAGRQHMNGERAIEYARSRHSLEDGTDFGRSRRQQRLLAAIKDKALSKEGLTKAFSLMDGLSKDFQTNLTVGQVKTLADLARTIDPATMDRVSIDNTNYLADGVTADGQDVLVPRDRTWAPLRVAVASLMLDPAIKTEGAHVQVWNGSGVTGVAASATNALTELGLQTLPPQNLQTGNLDQTEVHDLTQGRGASTVSFLASYFHAKVVTESPAPDEPVDIKVILGKTYRMPDAIEDAYDPTVRLGFAPPVVETRASSKPAATPSATAAVAKSPAPTTPAPRSSAAPTQVPVATVKVGSPKPAPTSIRR